MWFYCSMEEVVAAFDYERKNFDMTSLERYIQALTGVTGDVTVTQRTTEGLKLLREHLKNTLTIAI